MNLDAAVRNLDELDLRHVAKILKRVYPHYSLCECARMAAEFVPVEGSTCSLCALGTYPGCLRTRRKDVQPHGHASPKAGAPFQTPRDAFRKPGPARRRG